MKSLKRQFDAPGPVRSRKDAPNARGRDVNLTSVNSFETDNKTMRSVISGTQQFKEIYMKLFNNPGTGSTTSKLTQLCCRTQ